jgi:hypothetical protein
MTTTRGPHVVSTAVRQFSDLLARLTQLTLDEFAELEPDRLDPIFILVVTER